MIKLQTLPSLCVSDSFQQNCDQTSAAEEGQTCWEGNHHCMQSIAVLRIKQDYDDCDFNISVCVSVCVDHSRGDKGQQSH